MRARRAAVAPARAHPRLRQFRLSALRNPSLCLAGERAPVAPFPGKGEGRIVRARPRGALTRAYIPRLRENPKTPLPNGAIRILPNG